jgi:hypothetical protein
VLDSRSSRIVKDWQDLTVDTPQAPAAVEAVVVTEAVMGLAGRTIHPHTLELISRIGRRELTGDQAIRAIINRWMPGLIRDEASV